MNAIRFVPSSKTLEFVPVPTPKITQDWEVIVKVAYSGLCGTDLHIIEGKFPCDHVVLGHEFSGTVIAHGPAVNNLSVGDLVVVDPNHGCGKCQFCHSKQPHFCTSMGSYGCIGTKNNGGWAQYCICSVEQVHKLPKSISLKTAALTEPLSCITHGWDLVSPIIVGQEILVMGGGIIGKLWASLLHFQGHRKVTVAEINPIRLDSLKKLFGDRFSVVSPKDLQDRVDMFDLIVDCTGYCPVIEQELSLLKKGGKLCMFGVAPPDGRITVSPYDIYLKELTILSVKINPFSFPKAIGLIEAMGDRYLDYDKLGIKVFKQEDYEQALNELKTGNITKAMFHFC